MTVKDLIDKETLTPVKVDEGESHDVTGQFVDAAGADILLANLVTFVFTLYNELGLEIINSQNDTNAKNTGNHTVTSGGAWTIRLQPADNVIIDGTLNAGDVEYHVVRTTWTWSDGTATRTGIDERRFPVTKLSSPTP